MCWRWALKNVYWQKQKMQDFEEKTSQLQAVLCSWNRIAMWPPLAKSTVPASGCPKRWIQMPHVSSDPLSVCGLDVPSSNLSLLLVRLILFFLFWDQSISHLAAFNSISYLRKIPPLSGLPPFFFQLRLIFFAWATLEGPFLKPSLTQSYQFDC